MQFPTLCRAIVGAFTFALLASPAWAGTQHPGSITAEKVEDSPAAVADAKARFSCELRPFSLAKGLFCYGPAAIRSAYGLNGLIDSGSNGAGQTIVILDAYGSPTAAADLATFDSIFGVPAPPSFKVVTMPGTPAFDPTDGNMVGWAEETSLDVQWSHAVAPGASIVLVAAASNSDEDLIAGLNYALDNNLGSVVSMSFGESEAFLTDKAGDAVVDAWERAFKKARKHRVSLFVSSGDQGATNTGGDDVLPFRNVSYPASSARVTAVGGTNLFFGTAVHADPNGTYQGEQVWNDGFGAGGGGVSVLFKEPDYQEDTLPRSMQKQLHRHRGIPDVAYNAGVVGGVIVHLGFLGSRSGNYIFGGTSAGAPQWAGIIADVNSAVGRPVGFINDRLYHAGRSGATAGLFHDVILGDNSWDDGYIQVTGFPATPGWDLATGFGTPNFGTLGALLADPDDQHDDD